MSRVLYVNELSHHGVKGMKWGVRKADYNTAGMKSKDLYDRLEDLDFQERSALYSNRGEYNKAKKRFESFFKK